MTEVVGIGGRVIARFSVSGQPRTKGSLTPQMSRGAGGKLRVHLVESGEYAVPWKNTMIKAIRQQVCNFADLYSGEPYAGPVEVRVVFFCRRTVGVGGEVWPSHQTPRPTAADVGDLDKFERNLLDALTQSRLIDDDRYVTIAHGAKFWAPEGRDAGIEVLVLADDGEGIPPEFAWALS